MVYENMAPLTLAGGDVELVATIPHGSVAAEQAGRPVGIPVVVERTPDTPGIHQLDVASTAEYSRQEHRIGRLAKANALIRTRTARAAEHPEARRCSAGGDHVLGVTS